MLTSAPVDRDDDLARCFIDVRNDVDDQRTHQSLARGRRHGWRVPGGVEILCKTDQLGCSDQRRFRRVSSTHSLLDFFYTLQSYLPTLLELRDDETVLWVTGGVPALCKRGFIARLLQIEFDDSFSFLSAMHLQLLGFQRGFDRQWLDCAKQLTSHGGIDSLAAEGHAATHPQRLIGPLASIHGLRIAPGVYDRQAPAAAPAEQQAGEQCAPAATRLGAACLTVRVGCQLPLVAFELIPADVSLMMILEHDLPLVGGSSMAVGLAGAAVDDLSAMLALAVGIDAGIERVLEHRDDVAVTNRVPLEAGELLSIRRPGKVDLVSDHRQMDLPCAAHFSEPSKDQTDRFLKALIGVKGQAIFAIPEVSDRDADPELAAPRHRASSIMHAGAEHAQFELADASLHAEQQSVVRTARIVDTVHVDDAGLNQAAQIEQVMPVPPIARQPGRVEAENGADLASAQRGDEPLEPWPCHGAAAGPAQVIVDQLDVVEALGSRDLDEVVLTSFALEIRLDLRLRGLTNVDDRLAPEDARGQRLSDVGHRHAPSPARPRRAAAHWRGPRSLALSPDRSGPAAHRCRVTGGTVPVDGETRGTAKFESSRCVSSLMETPSWQVRPIPDTWSVRCSSSRADTAARGSPRTMCAHAAASSIHAATTMTTPGDSSMWTTAPPARCSL